MSKLDLPAMSHAQLQYEIEQFLFEEAALLDDLRFQNWLGLFSRDIRYLMPTRINQVEREGRRNTWGREGLPFFDETWDSLRIRVERLADETAWAEAPPSRTRRLITNIRLRDIAADRLVAWSNFLVYRSRRERDEDLFVGKREDRLVRRPGASWQIASREIRLEQTVLAAHNLSIFF